ncbi:MAG: cysteine desulfurase [Deltaproteobacteria bacterium]|nr:cysteine desulfurase [Deltaproteobacteria bacterium]
METVYLDNISLCPVLPEVRRAMARALEEDWGNPSSQHRLGEKSAEALAKAREQVAGLIGANLPREVVFTSCGTESVNLAIKGTAWAAGEKGKHIVTTNIEHNAVIRSLRRLKQMGFSITSVPVDGKGRVDPATVAKAIRKDTVLVSVMWANNEMGTIQPVEEISRVCREKKVPLHVDAVDAVGLIPVNVEELGAQLVSFASNPYGGPAGVGGLYIRRGTRLWPLLDGGVQEGRNRAGTENLLGVIGMGEAARLAAETLPARMEYARGLRNRLLEKLPRVVDDFLVNGDPDNCLPNLVSVSIRHLEGESIMLMLDEEGVAVSTRSACASGSLRASHVLLSAGLDFADAQGTLVISFGPQNTEADVDRFLEVLGPTVKSLLAISPLYKK